MVMVKGTDSGLLFDHSSYVEAAAAAMRAAQHGDLCLHSLGSGGTELPTHIPPSSQIIFATKSLTHRSVLVSPAHA